MHKYTTISFQIGSGQHLRDINMVPGTVHLQVRHPGVSGIMHRDFVLMQRAAALCSRLPGLAELRLEESIRQFGGPLKEQVRAEGGRGGAVSAFGGALKGASTWEVML